MDNNIQPYIDQTHTTSNHRTPQLFEFKAIPQEDVSRIITSMPTNKSPGPDKVNMRAMKDALPYILTSITNIINNSLFTSTYLEAWKLAEVIPLLKDGAHEIAPNNCPLSFLVILSKICEKVALKQFSEYHGTKKLICIFANLVAKLMQIPNLVIFVHFCTDAKLEICYIFAAIAKLSANLL